VPRKKRKLWGRGRHVGAVCSSGGGALHKLPGRRLGQQAGLQGLGIRVGQQQLGRAKAELAGARGDAGGGRQGLGPGVSTRLGPGLSWGATRDAREGDLLVAEQQQRS
jgi:hypothetical protein